MTKQQGYFVYIFVTILFIISIWGGTLYFFYDDPERGTFGDMFGAANALFSGLAFTGLILAIVFQKEELTLQRKELQLTRNELEGQKEELRIQNETMTLQQFENTFFQMLRLHHEIINGTTISTKKEFTGRDGFNEFLRRLNSYWKICHEQSSGHRYANLRGLELLNKIYLEFCNARNHPLGHYFRNLYNLIKFIDKSKIQDKTFYTNLVRAQLSNSELTLLFYNCFSDIGNKKFKPLVLKYNILKSLDGSALFQPREHCLLIREAMSEHTLQ
jgi:uncharacterized protein YjbI with pentapeptide repeats